MKNIMLFGFICLISQISISQVIYDQIKSDKLGTTRKLKIQLPRNYETNKDKTYPIILVLDADYLFEPVAGIVDYSSYWEDMPEAIVVGVMQGNSRYEDCSYDSNTYFPSGQGENFFEFLGLELMPYIDKKYRTAKFIVGIGHDFTANFLNYYLFKSPPLLNGYIVLSPDLAPQMQERLAERIPTIQEKIFYYLATGSDDLKGLHTAAESLNLKLKGIKSNSFHYSYDNFEGATHYSLVAKAIPFALDKIFSVYRPITQEEFADVLLKDDTHIVDYLENKYDAIENLFGLTDKIRVSDFLATATAAEKRKKWDALREIAELAKKQYPNNVLGDYFLGRYYEATGNPKKAMRSYQNGFDKEDVDYITVDKMLDRAAEIKKDFGY
ncbi:esterase [Aequorivita sp. H23M31]|uniref:Esterase n=1 Tax=Aequorivita ciconiae TaxID=2494375 RepID=A0A410G3P6_9FLAO|nr:alpha/beta hydrolase-fold protein [Aequorivita sp. H23M31]QAA81890.1 esterase [Aequorivita sp. H23M31]